LIVQRIPRFVDRNMMFVSIRGTQCGNTGKSGRADYRAHSAGAFRLWIMQNGTDALAENSAQHDAWLCCPWGGRRIPTSSHWERRELSDGHSMRRGWPSKRSEKTEWTQITQSPLKERPQKNGHFACGPHRHQPADHGDLQNGGSPLQMRSKLPLCAALNSAYKGIKAPYKAASVLTLRLHL